MNEQAVRATDEAVNQLYVSIGHRISLETATQLVLKVSQYRIPEPIRQADLRSREVPHIHYLSLFIAVDIVSICIIL
jgi:deoxyinosine 3'endonuclease (endonuclease V)